MQLYPIVFFTAIIAFIHGIVVKKENSLYGPYEAGAPNLKHWDLTGSAKPRQTYIRLTTDEFSKFGGVWNSYPVLSNDWELHMQFHIHGRGTKEFGNGMAIWYVSDILQLGPVFGSVDYFSGLGIFIDTYEDMMNPHNHLHPYISGVVYNGSRSYKHDEDGTVGQIGGCYAPVRNPDWATKIAVSYIANVVTVFLDVDGQQQWTECFRAEGVHLPTHYYFGITASTGIQYSDKHDVIFITALDMNLPDMPFEDRNYIIPYAENELIHPRQDEIQKTVEQLQHFEENWQNFEERPEPKQEKQRDMKVELNQEKKKEIKKQLKQEIKEQLKQEKKREIKVEPKIEPEKPRPPPIEKTEKPKTYVVQRRASFLTKAVYISGIFIIVYVAYRLFKKWRTQRMERMQKRLY